MNKLEPDQEFVEYIVKSMVEHQDEVKTERTVDTRGVLIALSVHPEDMGRVIGKEGKTAAAIRTLLHVVGSRSKELISLKVLEPAGSTVRPKPAHQEVVTLKK